jgi:hypothetical protein
LNLTHFTQARANTKNKPSNFTQLKNINL